MRRDGIVRRRRTKHGKTMKRLLTMALLAILAIPLHAQRLVIGERVPDLNITQWLNGAPVSDGKAVMVEFYHSSNPKGAERLAQLDELAKSYGDRLAVIVVTREKDDAVISSLLGGNPSYRVGFGLLGFLGPLCPLLGHLRQTGTHPLGRQSLVALRSRRRRHHPLNRDTKNEIFRTLGTPPPRRE